MTFYSDLAADAHELIKEFGQTMTLKRLTPGAYDPATGTVSNTTTTETATGVELEYTSREIDGTMVLRGDKKLILSTTGIGAPKVDDTVTIGTTVYTLKNVQPLSPGGTVVIYTCQARA